MSKIKKPLKRIVSVGLALLILVTGCGLFGTGITADALVESVNGSDSLVRTSLSEIRSVLTSVSYSAYLAEHADLENARNTVEIDISKYNAENTTATHYYVDGGEYGTDGKVLLVADDGKVSFDVKVPEDAFYCIEIEYWTGNAKITEMGDVL